MCLFQYTIWWTTWASTAVGSTVWCQSQHQRQSFYAPCGNYKSPTNYYPVTSQLPTTTTRRPIHYLLRAEFRNCYYVSTTRSSVQFIRLQTIMFHPWKQLTYRERSLLQTFTTTAVSYTINWHCVPVRAVIPTPVMMSSSNDNQCWWCYDNPSWWRYSYFVMMDPWWRFLTSVTSTSTVQATWTELLRRQTGCRSLFDLGSGVCFLKTTFLQTGCRSCFFGLRFYPPPPFHYVFLHRLLQPVVCDDVSCNNVIRWRYTMMADVTLSDDDVPRLCSFMLYYKFFVYDLSYLAWCYGVVGVGDTRCYYTSCIFVFLTSRRLRHSAINLFVLQTPLRLRHTVVLRQYSTSTTPCRPRHPAAQLPWTPRPSTSVFFILRVQSSRHSVAFQFRVISSRPSVAPRRAAPMFNRAEVQSPRSNLAQVQPCSRIPTA